MRIPLTLKRYSHNRPKTVTAFCVPPGSGAAYSSSGTRLRGRSCKGRSARCKPSTFWIALSSTGGGGVSMPPDLRPKDARRPGSDPASPPGGPNVSVLRNAQSLWKGNPNRLRKATVRCPGACLVTLKAAARFLEYSDRTQNCEYLGSSELHATHRHAKRAQETCKICCAPAIGVPSIEQRPHRRYTGGIRCRTQESTRRRSGSR